MAKAPWRGSTARQDAATAADHQTDAVTRFHTTREGAPSALMPTCRDGGQKVGQQIAMLEEDCQDSLAPVETDCSFEYHIVINILNFHDQ